MAVDKTVQGVFDKAMYLIDAQNESTGSTSTTDTKEYLVRTIGILNNLLDDVFPATHNYGFDDDGARLEPDDLTAMTDTIDMDAYIVRSVLPVGLAAKLLSEENPTLANYFWQLYEERLERAKQTASTGWEDIASSDESFSVDIEWGQWGRW